MLRLDIGCGESKQPGFIGVDPYVVSADVHADMWKLPYADSTVDEIYSSHSLEHIPQERVIPTMKEWLRVLKPGGKLVLRTPDLLWVCKNFLEHPEPNWHLATLFGLQTHSGEFHQTGFTERILRNYLADAGWTIVAFNNIWSHSQNTLEFICTKE